MKNELLISTYKNVFGLYELWTSKSQLWTCVFAGKNLCYALGKMKLSNKDEVINSEKWNFLNLLLKYSLDSDFSEN